MHEQQSPIKNKMTNIKNLIVSIEKQFRERSYHIARKFNVIPTGSLSLDAALGIGGYPRGRIIDIFGPESSGKTTLALHAMREAQRAGGVAAFIGAEHTFDIAYARAIGVDTERLLVSQPDHGEQALEIVEMLTHSSAVDVVVIDSMAALTPKAEIEGDMGLQARLMSQALRKLTSVGHRTETTLIFINQLRQKIGVVFGKPETTTGGQALKFYASVRLDVRRIGPVKVGDRAVGSRTRVKVVKNKCACPFRDAELDIRWGVGIDTVADLLDKACHLGVVNRSGAHLSFAGEHIGQGRERAREALLARPALMASIRAAIEASDTVPQVKVTDT